MTHSRCATITHGLCPCGTPLVAVVFIRADGYRLLRIGHSHRVKPHHARAPCPPGGSAKAFSLAPCIKRVEWGTTLLSNGPAPEWPPLVPEAPRLEPRTRRGAPPGEARTLVNAAIESLRAVHPDYAGLPVGGRLAVLDRS